MLYSSANYCTGNPHIHGQKRFPGPKEAKPKLMNAAGI